MKNFRNTVMITEDVPEPIDPGCLWQLVDGMLVLVDDDQYVAIDYARYGHLFEEEG